MLTRLLVTWAIGLVLLFAVSAKASPEAAAQLFQRGEDAFNQGMLQRAIAVLSAARQETNVDAKLQAQIALYLGLCYAAENNVDQARTYLREALLADPSLRLDPEQHKPELVALLEGVRTALQAELTVTTDRFSAEIIIDGEERGSAPFRGKLPPGSHIVEVRAGDGREVRTIELQPGQSTVLMLTPKEGDPAQRMIAVAPSANAAPWPTVRVLALSSGAAALTAAAGAVAVGLWSRADQQRACSLLASPPDDCASRTVLTHLDDLERYQKLTHSAASKASAANVCWGAAAGFGLAAVVFGIIDAMRDPGDSPHVGRTNLNLGFTGKTLSLMIDL